MLIASIIKEFRLLSRDLHGVAVLFIMPILFMLIMSAALSKHNESQHQAKIVLLSKQDEQFSQEFIRGLQQENLNIQFGDIEQINLYKQQLQQQQLDLLIINDNSPDNDLLNKKPLKLWLMPSTDSSWVLAIKGILQRYYIEQRINYYLKNNTIQLKNNQSKQIKQIEQQVNQQLDDKFEQITQYLSQNVWQEIYLNRQGKEVAKPNSVQHSVPAWLIFGMFFILIPLSNVMAMERQTNTITRLCMARVSAWQLIIAKCIPYMLINQFQFIGMVALGYFVLPLFDMPTFYLSGELLAYMLLSSCVSLSALGYGLLISVVTKTTEQAVVLGGGGIIIMAALGGIMVPTYVMPEFMKIVAQFSPMGWALTAFQSLLLNQYQLSQILPQLGLLSAFGCITLLIATGIYQYQLKTQVKF